MTNLEIKLRLQDWFKTLPAGYELFVILPDGKTSPLENVEDAWTIRFLILSDPRQVGRSFIHRHIWPTDDAELDLFFRAVELKLS